MNIKTKVYYDPHINNFRTIRGVSHDGFIVSHGTDFYNDAKSTVMEEIMEEDKFNDLIQIDDIENFPYAEKIDIGFDSVRIWDYKATEVSIGRMSPSQLENLLDISITNEDYEKASKIRDQIRVLNGK
jgi:hypothetical protein